ncbi:hypothetical protein OPT61_g1158 [Boeremia exigua]|uniref:Uncharacterized protein n=1 Tax=Boeremia exigua TaxID=749465 RepID=A0ACC2IRF3_9PLEO|nr:hypothetical protein OPT61_g1158 [Boeremia exigua]
MCLTSITGIFLLRPAPLEETCIGKCDRTRRVPASSICLGSPTVLRRGAGGRQMRCKGVRKRLAREEEVVRDKKLGQHGDPRWSSASMRMKRRRRASAVQGCGKSQKRERRKRRSIACISSFVRSTVEASRRPKHALLRADTARQWAGRGLSGMIPRQIESLMLTDGPAANDDSCSPMPESTTLGAWKRAKVGSKQVKLPRYWEHPRQHP